MLKYYLIIFSFIHSINSDPINRQNCSVCELNGHFNPLNGYGCLPRRVNETICTCPDGVWIANQPCRICNREKICGPATARCDEAIVSDPTQNKPYFICFCSSNSISIGKRCPEDASSTTSGFSSNTTATPSPSTSSTKRAAATSNTQTSPECDSSSHLYVEPMLIILLNLVYFVNK